MRLEWRMSGKVEWWEGMRKDGVCGRRRGGGEVRKIVGGGEGSGSEWSGEMVGNVGSVEP